MDLTPIVHDREEELIDPCDFIPPSFFIDSIYLNNSSNSFVEPPEESLTLSSTPVPSPLTRTAKPHPVNQPKPLTHPLSPHNRLSTSSPRRSPSCDDPSSPQQPVHSTHHIRSSPIAIANFPDRPRPPESNRKLISDKVSAMTRFTRTPPLLATDQVSARSPESVMHYPTNTARFMRVVTSAQSRALGAKRSFKRR